MELRKSFPLLLAVSVGLPSLGSVIKKKDGIELTRTDSVTYQEKAKEEAEGKKGPPAPTLKLFPKEGFLSEGPVGKPDKVAPTEKEGDIESWFEEEKTEPQAKNGKKERKPEKVKKGKETDDTAGHSKATP